jgi:hypothetical protein
MLTEQWQLGLLAGAFVFHLLVIGLAYRRRDPSPASTPERDLVDREAGVIECPTCAVENDLGYTYCRSCVSELPGSMGFDGAGDSPLGRIAR